jgi:hypothetical protein
VRAFLWCVGHFVWRWHRCSGEGSCENEIVGCGGVVDFACDILF